MTPESKQIVVRLIEEVMNGGNVDLIDELFSQEKSGPGRGWIDPFREAWRGSPPTGRRFEGVDEVYFFRIVEGRIAEAWGLEDTAGRLRQLRRQGKASQAAAD